VSARDRSLISGALVLALVGAFWLLALGPKRSDLGKLDTQVQKSQKSYEAARQQTEQFAVARQQFPRAYANLVRLGKAVPAEADVPSLVVQLDQAASAANVDFRKISLDTSKSGPVAPVAAPAASGGSSGSSTSGSDASKGTAATGASGAQGSSTPSTGSTGASGAAGQQPADALDAATVPIGATIGSAGLPILRFNFTFQGNFFKMARLVHNIRKLVLRRNKNLIVSGRLLTVDGISLGEGESGFPQVKASISATAYLVPASQGLLDGATAQGPDGAVAGTPTPASTSSTGTVVPPAAVVTTP
jgi:hypothetical protein